MSRSHDIIISGTRIEKIDACDEWINVSWQGLLRLDSFYPPWIGGTVQSQSRSDKLIPIRQYQRKAEAA